jgi:hypothetical protein
VADGVGVLLADAEVPEVAGAVVAGAVVAGAAEAGAWETWAAVSAAATAAGVASAVYFAPRATSTTAPVRVSGTSTAPGR